MPSSGCKTCALDRKSTRLNSSHTIISYAVFCLEKEHEVGEEEDGSLEHAGEEGGAAPVRPGAVPHELVDAVRELVALDDFFFKLGGPHGRLPFSPPRASPS